MILAHPYYFEPIILSETSPYTIVIENTKYFRKMILELFSSYRDEQSDYVLSHKNEILSISKNSLILNDFFNLSFDNRQLKTKLFQELYLLADDDIFHEAAQKLIQFGEYLCTRSSLPISFNSNITINELIKYLNFQFDVSELNEIEKTLEIINCYYELVDIKIVITINLKDYLTETEYIEFAKYLQYKNIPLLLFEQRTHQNDDLSRTTIIDKDLCIL